MDDNNSTTGREAPETTEPKPEPSVRTPTESPTKEAEKADAQTSPFRRELALAIIQHANRSVAILLIALMVAIGVFFARDRLANLLVNAESIKAGSFEIKLRQAAVDQHVAAEFARLAGLTDHQLQLFLILGKARKTDAAGRFDIEYTGEEITRENLEVLQQVGLLSGVKEVAPAGSSRFEWTVTPKGTQLHSLLLEQIVRSVRNAAKGAQGD